MTVFRGDQTGFEDLPYVIILLSLGLSSSFHKVYWHNRAITFVCYFATSFGWNIYFIIYFKWLCCLVHVQRCICSKQWLVCQVQWTQICISKARMTWTDWTWEKLFLETWCQIEVFMLPVYMLWLFLVLLGTLEKAMVPHINDSLLMHNLNAWIRCMDDIQLTGLIKHHTRVASRRQSLGVASGFVKGMLLAISQWQGKYWAPLNHSGIITLHADKQTSLTHDLLRNLNKHLVAHPAHEAIFLLPLKTFYFCYTLYSLCYSLAKCHF